MKTDISQLREKFPRILGISTFDTGGTMLIAYPISTYTGVDYMKTLLALVVLGEGLHFLFSVSTPITRLPRF